MSTDTLHAEPQKSGAVREGKTRVRIADVAARLGLTKGTVSRALNGYPDIAESTRLRVKRVAEDLGYRPLSHAQAIRTGRVKSLGLVLQISEHDGHAPFLTDFLAGVTTAASDEGWTLAVSTAHSDADMEAVLGRMVDERKADGFILPRTRTDDPRVAFLRAEGVPFILYGRTGTPAGCAWFDIAGDDAMAGAVARLVALGHRRIGFVNGGREYNYCRLRQQGFLQGMAKAGLVPDPAQMIEDVRRTADSAEATLALLRQPEPPTAIVYATDAAALGAYHAAATLGISIGQEVSVIGYDGIPEGAYATPPLTTFSVDNRAAGRTLARLLIRRIEGASPDTLRQLGAATLISRGSDQPPTLTSTALAAHLRDLGQQGPTSPKGGTT